MLKVEVLQGENHKYAKIDNVATAYGRLVRKLTGKPARKPTKRKDGKPVRKRTKKKDDKPVLRSPPSLSRRSARLPLRGWKTRSSAHVPDGSAGGVLRAWQTNAISAHHRSSSTVPSDGWHSPTGWRNRSARPFPPLPPVHPRPHLHALTRDGVVVKVESKADVLGRLGTRVSPHVLPPHLQA